MGLALLNLCVLLPLIIIAWRVSHLPAHVTMAQVPDLLTAGEPPLLFAPGVGAVDASLLVVLGLWFLPVSAGRWIPGRLEGAALLACYAIYLLMSAYVNRSW